MTDNAYDFAHDAAAVREATDRLLVAVGKLDDDAIGEPSLLPDWTRGHILAHLARNADALVNLLTWARTGVPAAMYESAASRDADIERDADRSLAAHLDDLRASAARFNEAADALPPERWSYEVEMRNGVIERAARLPFRRLAELELHHIDLGVGYGVDQLPAFFVDTDLEFMATVKLAGRDQVPPLELRTHDGRSWRTGRTSAGEGTPLVVTGSPAALVGWLTGRTKGAGLDTQGAALPPLPPL